MSIKRKYTGPAGFAQFSRDMDAFAKKFAEDKPAAALRDATAIVVREAKHRCPVGVQRKLGDAPGNLRRSIASVVRKRPGGRAVGYVGTDVDYGMHLEFGTRYIHVGTPANPDTEWPAKWETGTIGPESMPWLRSAIYAKRAQVVKAIRGVAK